MRKFADLAEFVAAKGEHLGYSDWHQITQDQVTMFADATGDHQWIHVDIDRAKAGPFGGPIAHGFLTLSLLPMLGAEIYQVGGLIMGINYGLEKVLADGKEANFSFDLAQKIAQGMFRL